LSIAWAIAARTSSMLAMSTPEPSRNRVVVQPPSVEIVPRFSQLRPKIG
jgi:hypothetical protein